MNNTADDYMVAGAAFQRAHAILTEHCVQLEEPESDVRLRKLYHNISFRIPLGIDVFKQELNVMREEVDPGMTPERCATIIARSYRRRAWA